MTYLIQRNETGPIFQWWYAEQSADSWTYFSCSLSIGNTPLPTLTAKACIIIPTESYLVQAKTMPRIILAILQLPFSAIHGIIQFSRADAAKGCQNVFIFNEDYIPLHKSEAINSFWLLSK